MAADVERRTQDPQAELLWEAVLIQRARRRLVEFELTRRRALLVLTLALPIAGVALVLLGEPYAGGGLAGASMLASGAAAVARREDRDR